MRDSDYLVEALMVEETDYLSRYERIVIGLDVRGGVGVAVAEKVWNDCPVACFLTLHHLVVPVIAGGWVLVGSSVCFFSNGKTRNIMKKDLRTGTRTPWRNRSVGLFSFAEILI